MIKINEMAKRLSVSIKTLQRWDRDGILVAKRTPTELRQVKGLELTLG